MTDTTSAETMKRSVVALSSLYTTEPQDTVQTSSRRSRETSPTGTTARCEFKHIRSCSLSLPLKRSPFASSPSSATITATMATAATATTEASAATRTAGAGAATATATQTTMAAPAAPRATARTTVHMREKGSSCISPSSSSFSTSAAVVRVRKQRTQQRNDAFPGFTDSNNNSTPFLTSSSSSQHIPASRPPSSSSVSSFSPSSSSPSAPSSSSSFSSSFFSSPCISSFTSSSPFASSSSSSCDGFLHAKKNVCCPPSTKERRRSKAQMQQQLPWKKVLLDAATLYACQAEGMTDLEILDGTAASVFDSSNISTGRVSASLRDRCSTGRAAKHVRLADSTPGGGTTKLGIAEAAVDVAASVSVSIPPSSNVMKDVKTANTAAPSEALAGPAVAAVAAAPAAASSSSSFSSTALVSVSNRSGPLTVPTNNQKKSKKQKNTITPHQRQKTSFESGCEDQYDDILRIDEKHQQHQRQQQQRQQQQLQKQQLGALRENAMIAPALIARTETKGDMLCNNTTLATSSSGSSTTTTTATTTTASERSPAVPSITSSMRRRRRSNQQSSSSSTSSSSSSSENKRHDVLLSSSSERRRRRSTNSSSTTSTTTTPLSWRVGGGVVFTSNNTTKRRSSCWRSNSGSSEIRRKERTSNNHSSLSTESSLPPTESLRHNTNESSKCARRSSIQNGEGSRPTKTNKRTETSRHSDSSSRSLSNNKNNSKNNKKQEVVHPRCGRPCSLEETTEQWVYVTELRQQLYEWILPLEAYGEEDSFHPAVLRALADQRFYCPTPVQRAVLLPALRDRRDIIAAAETGSGKTLAYGVPIVCSLLAQMLRRQQKALEKQQLLLQLQETQQDQHELQLHQQEQQQEEQEQQAEQQQQEQQQQQEKEEEEQEEKVEGRKKKKKRMTSKEEQSLPHYGESVGIRADSLVREEDEEVCSISMLRSSRAARLLPKSAGGRTTVAVAEDDYYYMATKKEVEHMFTEEEDTQRKFAEEKEAENNQRDEKERESVPKKRRAAAAAAAGGDGGGGGGGNGLMEAMHHPWRQRRDATAAASTAAASSTAAAGTSAAAAASAGSAAAAVASAARAASAASEGEVGGPECFVLVPSRELAAQVQEHLSSLCVYTPIRCVCLVGGLSVQKQQRLLAQQRPQILVATPGRLYALLQQAQEAMRIQALVNPLFCYTNSAAVSTMRGSSSSSTTTTVITTLLPLPSTGEHPATVEESFISTSANLSPPLPPPARPRATPPLAALEHAEGAAGAGVGGRRRVQEDAFAYLHCLHTLRFLVLDEVDRLIKQGSFPELDALLTCIYVATGVVPSSSSFARVGRDRGPLSARHYKEKKSNQCDDDEDTLKAAAKRRVSAAHSAPFVVDSLNRSSSYTAGADDGGGGAAAAAGPASSSSFFAAVAGDESGGGAAPASSFSSFSSSFSFSGGADGDSRSRVVAASTRVKKRGKGLFCSSSRHHRRRPIRTMKSSSGNPHRLQTFVLSATLGLSESELLLHAARRKSYAKEKNSHQQHQQEQQKKRGCKTTQGGSHMNMRGLSEEDKETKKEHVPAAAKRGIELLMECVHINTSRLYVVDLCSSSSSSSDTNNNDISLQGRKGFLSHSQNHRHIVTDAGKDATVSVVTGSRQCSNNHSVILNTTQAEAVVRLGNDTHVLANPSAANSGIQMHGNNNCNNSNNTNTALMLHDGLVKLPQGLRITCLKTDTGEEELHLALLLLTLFHAASSNESAKVLVFVNAISYVYRLDALLRIILGSAPTRGFKRPWQHDRQPEARGAGGGRGAAEVFGLHAHLQQKQRIKRMERFRTAERAVLVCTDVASRGLDIQNVKYVIHFQPPRTPTLFVHRSGRTARAKQAGESICVCSPALVDAWLRVARPLQIDMAALPAPTCLQQQQVPGGTRGVYAQLSKIKRIFFLATQIDSAMQKNTKTKRTTSWLKKAAASADIVLDSDISEEDSGAVHAKKLKGQQKELTQALRGQCALITLPLHICLLCDITSVRHQSAYACQKFSPDKG